MAKRFLIACFVSIAFGAHAGPILFTNVQYDTTSIAVAESIADVDTSASPPLPTQSDALVVGVNDFAAADALGASGLLSTVAEADSVVGPASAEAQSHFVGNFLGNGPLFLRFGLVDLTSTIGGGTGSGILFVLLTNTVGTTTTTLFNDFFSVAGVYNLFYNLPVGGVSTLDLLLFSEASTTGRGQSGQNSSQVTFSGIIPTPATLLLFAAGLAAMLAVRRKSAPSAM